MSRPKAACGTLSAYTRGCKCEKCLLAGKQYRDERDSDPERRARQRKSMAKYESSDLGKSTKRANRKARVAELRALVHDAKLKPCVDCRVSFPYYVMDFDHRPGEPKLFGIATYARFKPTVEALQAEIAKCDVICSNCHRERTHQRRALK